MTESRGRDKAKRCTIQVILMESVSQILIPATQRESCDIAFPQSVVRVVLSLLCCVIKLSGKV